MHYLIQTIISGLGWGLAPLLDRYSLRYIDAMTLVSIRSILIGLCGLVTFIILKLTKKNQLQSGYNSGKSKFVMAMILAPAFCLIFSPLPLMIQSGR